MVASRFTKYLLGLLVLAVSACNLNTSPAPTPDVGSPILATLPPLTTPTITPVVVVAVSATPVPQSVIVVVSATPHAQAQTVVIANPTNPPPAIVVVTSSPAPGVTLAEVGTSGLQPSAAASCVVSNSSTNALVIYTTPDTSSKPAALLTSGSGVVAFQYAAGWYEINYTAGNQQFTGWVSETAVTATPDCAGLRQPAVCSVQPSVGRIINIYAQPDPNSAVVSSLGPLYYLPYVQTNAAGWFNVTMGGGANGWIAPNEGKLVGAC